REVYLIDFDKCFFKKLKESDKKEMISRLLRSFEKEVRININHKKIYFDSNDFKYLEERAF
ncbi:MAG: hypothetical protein ACI4M9_03730, partial [Succinivibrio sp.]